MSEHAANGARNRIRLILGRDPVASHFSVDWAVQRLKQCLLEKGLEIDEAIHGKPAPEMEAADGVTLVIAGSDVMRGSVTPFEVPEEPESFVLCKAAAGKGTSLFASAPDTRGLMYAVLELADRAACSDDPLAALMNGAEITGRPANPVRGILRTFANEKDDKAWFYDRSFWEEYLTNLAIHRFNRIHLALGMGYDHGHDPGIRDNYFCFAYPFLVDVPGYEVRVKELAEGEAGRNLEMLRFIGREAKRRNLEFHLGFWTHAYEMKDSPEAKYTVEGMSPDIHAPYCRDALTVLLQRCPEIDGITLRVHYESGIPEPARQFWEVVFEGVKRAGRPVHLDLHPKGLEHDLLESAVKTGLPVSVSPKYWAEHMGLPYHQAAIRETELPREPKEGDGDKIITYTSRRFTRYGYADFLKEGRKYGVLHRIWPGTQRVLIWGDPALASGYGRHGSFCGSIGVEICEPLSFKSRKGSETAAGRDPYIGDTPGKRGDWAHYQYTYRIWGRHLYNPDADPEEWRRYLRSEFGAAAAAAEQAMGFASRILPLVTTVYLPSASNNWFWPEMYENMRIVQGGKPPKYGFDSPPPHTFGSVSPLDPALFYRINDYADDLINNRRSGKYTPVTVAGWLSSLADQAEFHLKEMLTAAHAGNEHPPFGTLLRWATDIAAMAGLGRFFAAKLRAGVSYALYERSGDPEQLREAVDHYRTARDAWLRIVEATKDRYVPDITFGYVSLMRGHWADRLAGIEEDLREMEAELAAASGRGTAANAGLKTGDTGTDQGDTGTDQTVNQPLFSHVPPQPFVRGEDITIRLTVPDGLKLDWSHAPLVTLHYRRVNQAEPYRTEVMSVEEGSGYSAVIPGHYTDSPFPILYFFEVREQNGKAWIEPGFNETFNNLPYHVLRQRI